MQHNKQLVEYAVLTTLYSTFSATNCILQFGTEDRKKTYMCGISSSLLYLSTTCPSLLSVASVCMVE